MDKTIIVYHQVKPGIDCPDGICAAWIAAKYCKLNGIDYDVVGDSYKKNEEYQNHKFPFDPELNDIILCDFSYPWNVMMWLSAKSKTLTVLDHHESQMGDISRVQDRIFGGYSADDCGATFAWRYFFPNLEAPWFLEHVWKRDTGSEGYYDGDCPQSESITTAMSARRKGLIGIDAFPVFDALDRDATHEELIGEGRELLKERDLLVKSELDSYKGEYLELSVDDISYCVPCLTIKNPEADKHYSIIGSKLSRLFEKSPFVAIVTSSEPNKVSLRAHSKSDANCGAIARAFGGGGHKNAAGFTRS